MGLIDCSGTCANPLTDPSHCGGCTTACLSGQVCSAGKCTTYCKSGLTACSGSCVDLQSNAAHCGGCTTKCKSGYLCKKGKCALPGSCKEILTKDTTSKSGTYSIQTSSTTSPVKVYCDMSTDNGGWTRVWLSTSNNLNKGKGQYSYISGTPPVVAASGRVRSATYRPSSVKAADGG